MNKVLNVKCPQCGTEFSYYDSKFRPFCTERCRMVDLGHWLEESYKIPDTRKQENTINEKELNEFEIEDENHNPLNQSPNIDEEEDDETNYY